MQQCGCSMQGPGVLCSQGKRLFLAVARACDRLEVRSAGRIVPVLREQQWQEYLALRDAYFAHIGEKAQEKH